MVGHEHEYEDAIGQVPYQERSHCLWQKPWWSIHRLEGEVMEEARWIVVGNLRIVELPDGRFWIGEKEGGEGGSFGPEFTAFVEEFYRLNF